MTNIFVSLVQRYKKFYKNGFFESMVVFVTVKWALYDGEDLWLSNFTESLNLQCQCKEYFAYYSKCADYKGA